MSNICNKAALATYWSEFNKKRLIKRFYKKIYRGVHRAINHATRRGVLATTYCFNNYKYGLDAIILIEVCHMVKETLTQEGYYVRKYQFGMEKDVDEFTVAWGDGIAEHQHLDELQLKFREERRKEREAQD